MDIPFSKYQGCGNDFILIDDRVRHIEPDTQLFNKLCNRRFGIGADGIMLLQNHPDYDFEMVYFNADGKEGSMCGNGGRCIAVFARDLGLISKETRFLAVDGPHYAKISDQTVSLQMKDVSEAEAGEDYYLMDTGSPHYITLAPDLKDKEVASEGRTIRFSDRFKEKGVNVNFVEEFADRFFVRTYERGVEDETWACGTGVAAVALSMAIKNQLYGCHTLSIQVLGGMLRVSFNRTGERRFTDIYLKGPAEFVFQGIFSL